MNSTNTGARATLPDFRNLGVLLRLLLLAELANLASFIAYAPEGFPAMLRLTESSLLFEMALLCVALALFVASPCLRRLSYRRGALAVLTIAALLAGGLDFGLRALVDKATLAQAGRAAAIAALLTVMILVYFDWRQRVLSPALTESRLIALQARIRPHFLFNSLNAALSVVREDPRRAEQVLLDMSDLFRMVLAEPRALLPLDEEIRLAKAYLAIEQVRLGERLRVRWDCEDAPQKTLVPVLMLQPLVENAVWHGIEPSAHGGEIAITIGRRGKVLRIAVTNPVPHTARTRQQGNRMALANIEERLALHFDAEAGLRITANEREFSVHVHLPVTEG